MELDFNVEPEYNVILRSPQQLGAILHSSPISSSSMEEGSPDFEDDEILSEEFGRSVFWGASDVYGLDLSAIFEDDMSPFDYSYDLLIGPHDEQASFLPEGSVKGSEAEDEQQFVCNICLEVAREAVVTSCGHLYCWRCLYRWIHVYSHATCPVCKGGVTDSNVIPIYGRGGATDEGEKMPPRPRAQRVDTPCQR